MPEQPIVPEGLSISEAFDKGLAADAAQVGGGGSPDNANNGSPTTGGDGAPPKPGEQGGKPPQPQPDPEEIDDDGNPIKKNDSPPTQPIIDPDTGKYVGEYTKERFDGLMGQWQKDRAEALRVADLEKEIARLKGDGGGDGKPAVPGTEPQKDFALPPELANADEETKNGYQVVMRGIQSQISGLEKNILSKVLGVINAPLKEENEITTKISSEMTELKISGGKLFADNTKEILDFAAKNEYPLGTLKQAFNAWKNEQELTGRIKTLEKGKEVITEIEKEENKRGTLPKTSKTVADTMPSFDVERDGSKSMDDIWEEAKKLI